MLRFSKPVRPTAAQPARSCLGLVLPSARTKPGESQRPSADQIEHENGKAAVDIHRLREIGDIPEIENAWFRLERPRQRLLSLAGDAAKQRRLPASFGPRWARKAPEATSPLRWCPPDAGRSRAWISRKLQWRGHAHLIESHTTAHKPSVTRAPAPSRERRS